MECDKCNLEMTSGAILSVLFEAALFRGYFTDFRGYDIKVFYMGSSPPADPAAPSVDGVAMTGAITPLSIRPDASDAYIFIDTSAAASGRKPAASPARAAAADDVTRRFRSIEVFSPSRAAEVSYAMRRLLAAPLSLKVEDSITAAFRRVVESQSSNWEIIMAEGTFYPLATEFLPPWVTSDVRLPTAKRKANDVFTCEVTPEGPYRLVLPWTCEPELFIRMEKGAPPVNGELKTAGDMRAFDGASTHVLLGMVQSLFSDSPLRTGTWRFYRRPPAGYVLVSFPYTAHFVSVEMVGRLFVAPISKPFVLGSAEHQAAVAALERIDCGPPIDFPWALAAAGRQLRYEDDVAWIVAPAPDGSFLKVITTGARWAQFDRIYKLYQHIATLPFAAAPPAIVQTELLFGFLCVAVRMPFVHGEVATPEQLHTDATVLDALADAIAWLLRHGVLYTDVRELNVIIERTGGDAGTSSGGAGAGAGAGAAAAGAGGGVGGGMGGRVRLVDYDDAILLPSPVTNRAEAGVAFAAVEGPSRTALDRWPARLRDAVMGRFP